MVAFSALMAILSGAWLASGASSDQPGWMFAALGPQLVCAAVAMVSLLVARADVIERRTRIAWAWIGLAFALRCLGEAGTAFELLGILPSGRTLADAGFLAYYPALFIGILSMPHATRSRAEGARWAMDTGIIVVAGATLVWFLSLHDVLLTQGRMNWRMAPELGYPIGDLVLVLSTATLWLRRRSRIRRGTETLLAIGLAFGFAANLLQAWKAPGIPVSALHPIDSLWLVCYLAVGAAALRQWTEPVVTLEEPADHEDQGLVPWLSTLGVYLLLALVFAPDATTRERGVLMGAIATTGLMLLRQATTQREHLRVARAVAERRSEARFQALVQHSSDLVLLVDAAGVIRFASTSATRVLGMTVDALVGARYLQLVHPDDVPLVKEYLSERRDGSTAGCPTVWRLKHADGRWLPLESVGVGLLHDATVRGIVLNARDVSERQALEAQLVQQAYHDSLTSLANRSLFRDRTVHALESRNRAGGDVAVVFIDLDDFKSVNDTMGHAAGDALLVQVSDRLLNATRGCDTVARLGGDEFAILLERLPSIEDALVVANRALAALTRPIIVEGREVYTPGSVGIAFAEPGDDADTLLRNADLAMYMAKRGGKGRYVVFESSMHSAALERMEMEADLRHAVAREELELRFQPIVNLESGEMMGIETLLRWRHPKRGLVAPLHFVPLAEETGMIVSIGRWVLMEACRQAAIWRAGSEKGRNLSVTVNVSARQVQDPSLPGDVAAALAMSGLPAHALILEITESVMMHDADAALERFTQLKALGVKLAIDDFGTGYSSLAYLKRFPVDILKIDKAFVEGVGEGADEGILTNAIVSLGATLSLRTVAEGIEHAHQLERLQELGCDLGQGYLFSHPVRAERVSEILNGSPEAAIEESETETASLGG